MDRNGRNGNGTNTEDAQVVSLPPRPRRVPTLVELHDLLLKLYDGQLELNERVGHLMRSEAQTQTDVREIRAELREMRDEDRDMRRRLESVPEMVHDAAEETGRHQIAELERKIAERDRDSAKQKLEKHDDRVWRVIVVVLAAALAVVTGVLVSKMTGTH